MLGRYANAPLLEAICELRFVPGVPWDLTVPGVLYERVKRQYPNKRQRGRVQLGVEAAPNAAPGTVSAVGGVTGMRFDSRDGKRVVQVDPDLLIVNQVRPYDGWVAFRRQVEDALGHYREAAAPEAIARAELRYVNQFPVESDLPLPERFNVYPQLPEEGEPLRNMLLMAELAREHPAGLFRVTFARARVVGVGDTLILDFQYATNEGDVNTCDGIFEWLDATHGSIEEMFDRAVTAATKETFGEVLYDDVAGRD